MIATTIGHLVGAMHEGVARSIADQIALHGPFLRVSIDAIESTASLIGSMYSPQEEQEQEYATKEEVDNMEEFTTTLELMQAEATELICDTKLSQSFVRNNSPTAFLDTSKWRTDQRSRRRRRRF
jgi:hypothetical protein